MNRKKIKDIIGGLFDKYGVSAAPIDVEAICEYQNITIRRRDFEEALSGFAYQKDGEKVIGVNADEGPLRQRFTIAHELGHLFLEPRENIKYDKQFAMQYRNGLSSEGTDVKEIEANFFAAELLMPEELLKNDIEQYTRENSGKTLDFEDDEVVGYLAGKYQVSRHAMSVRLASLHYI